VTPATNRALTTDHGLAGAPPPMAEAIEVTADARRVLATAGTYADNNLRLSDGCVILSIK